MKRIEREINLDAIGTVHAVRYPIDGTIHVWVVDGQHRVTALNALDMGDWSVDVMVHTSVMDDAGASKLFLALNDRAVVSPYDKFINEYQAGNPTVTQIVHMATSEGLKISRNDGANAIRGVSALKDAFGLDGGASLAKSLRVMKDAWGGEKGSFEGCLVHGFSIFYKTYGERIKDHKGFVQRLVKIKPGSIIGSARYASKFNRRTVNREIAAQLVIIYNKGRSSGQIIDEVVQ